MHVSTPCEAGGVTPAGLYLATWDILGHVGSNPTRLTPHCATIDQRPHQLSGVKIAEIAGNAIYQVPFAPQSRDHLNGRSESLPVYSLLARVHNEERTTRLRPQSGKLPYREAGRGAACSGLSQACGGLSLACSILQWPVHSLKWLFSTAACSGLSLACQCGLPILADLVPAVDGSQILSREED